MLWFQSLSNILSVEIARPLVVSFDHLIIRQLPQLDQWKRETANTNELCSRVADKSLGVEWSQVKSKIKVGCKAYIRKWNLVSLAWMFKCCRGLDITWNLSYYVSAHWKRDKSCINVERLSGCISSSAPRKMCLMAMSALRCQSSVMGNVTQKCFHKYVQNDSDPFWKRKKRSTRLNISQLLHFLFSTPFASDTVYSSMC